MATRSFSELHRTGIDWLSLLFVLLAIGAGGFGALLVRQFSQPWIALGLGFGLVVALATFKNPEIGLLALIFMSYIRLSDVLIKYHNLPSTAQPFIALLFVTILFRWILQGQRAVGWAGATTMVLMYGLVGFASLLYAQDYSRAFDVISDYLKDATIAVVVTILLRQTATLRWVVWTLLAAGLFMASISVFQQLTHSYSNNFGGFGQANIQNIAGQVNAYRVAGPIGDPNFYAQILVVLVPLALERFANERSTRLRLLAAWALAVGVLTIVFTFSRGGFVGLLVVTALMFLRRPPRPLVLLVTLGVVVLLIEFAPETYLDRLRTIPDSLPWTGGDVRNDISVRGRASEGAVAWLMFTDHPLLGVGLGNYPLLYQDYSRLLGLDQRNTDREPHDLYLEIAAETGIVGLLVFGFLLWFMFRGLQIARSNFERAKRAEYSTLVFAFEVGMIGYLTAALFLHNAYPRFFWLLFGIALALPQVAHNTLKEQEHFRMESYGRQAAQQVS